MFLWYRGKEKTGGRTSTKYLGFIFVVNPGLVIQVSQGFHTEDIECLFVQSQDFQSADDINQNLHISCFPHRQLHMQ